MTGMISLMAPIIPRPVEVERRGGTFKIKPDTMIIAAENILREAYQLSSGIESEAQFELAVVPKSDQKKNQIQLQLDETQESLAQEGYLLTVTPEVVKLCAPKRQGLFYAIQSFMQLLPVEEKKDKLENIIEIPSIRIRDYPRFGWRGAMLDVSRHFRPSLFIKKFIQLLALHKMNTLHLHLTDDQGWRIEIQKYSKLTEVGAWREETRVGHRLEQPERYDAKPHGGFYSQETLRELVAFAQLHHVAIVPEVDMPGHTQAAIAAYPTIGNVPEGVSVGTTWGVSKNILNPSEKTIKFMCNVLDEVMHLFPGEFVHIGGDEVDTEQWQQSQSAQAMMEQMGFNDEGELYGNFIHQIAAFILDRKHRPVGWDEILETAPPQDMIVMVWRGFDHCIRAVKAGHDVVMAPMEWTYLDKYQSEDTESEPLAIGGYLPLEKAYAFEPVPEALSADEAQRVLGGQGQLWTEYMPNEDHVEYMAFPRLTALAEALWTPVSERSFGDFIIRLPNHLRRLMKLGVNFYNPGKHGSSSDR